MIGDMFQAGTLAALDDLAKRVPPPKPKEEPGAFAGFGASTAPNALRSGLAKSIAGTADILGAFGDVAGAYPEAMGAPLSPEQRKQADEARMKLLREGPQFTSPVSDAMRTKAKDWMPDPATAGRGTQLVAGATEFVGEVVGNAPMGPLAPAGVAGTAGLAEAEKLKQEGVGLAARTKAGILQGGAAGASVLFPAAGKTVMGTVGLVGAAGTVNEAALAATQTVLRRAGNTEQANQYDPFDPWNVALSYVAPALIGGAVHTVRAARPTLAEVVLSNESGGRRYTKDGKLIEGPVTRSGERAQGEMQVMPATIADPGFGVTPAKNTTPDEIARVGRDYLAAMEKRYDGDPAKAMAAYNAGPGKLDAAIREHGANWLAHMPEETRGYVAKGLKKLGEDAPRAEPLPSQEVIDAARVQLDTIVADSARLTEAADMVGQNAHIAALERAHDQIAAGERVEVTDILGKPEAATEVLARMEARVQEALADPIIRTEPRAPDVEAAPRRVEMVEPPRAAEAPRVEPVRSDSRAEPARAEDRPAAVPARAGGIELGAPEALTPGKTGGIEPLRPAQEAAAANPDLMVRLDGMDAPVRVGELLERVQREAAEDAAEGSLVQAAVACLLRHQ